MTTDISVGDELPSFVRVTDFPEWNRYAAVNDEFIDVHMSADAAQAAGQPDVFGMGNLRIAYAHNVLHDWLDGRGDVAEFGCQFRGLNFRGDELTTWGRVVAVEERGGLRCADVELGVRNQDGVETTPGSATVVRFGSAAEMPPVPPPSQPSGAATPGTFLDEATIGKIGRTLPPVASRPVPFSAAAASTKAAGGGSVDAAAAEKGPWGGVVAPRDFDPFAWMPDRPWAGDWLWGMGTEPGRRVLNGGQRSVHGPPVRPGDVISASRRFVDVVERETKRGAMVFFTSEFRWENQHGELVKLAEQTTIYY